MPVREILLELSQDDFGGPVPTDGRFVATACRTRIAGEDVVLPAVLSMPIIDGEFEEPVFLEVTEAPYDWYWVIQIRDAEDTVQLRRNAAVPIGIDPIAIGDLPIIDPRSLEPVDVPEDMWWVQLEQRPVIVRLTQGEYDALTPEQKLDPNIFYVIPVLTP